MDKYALILAGGGGKGAYQVGVWQALHELGADKLIDAVAGTSVGAINGALYVAGDAAKAKALWEDIQPDDILTEPQEDNSSQLGSGLFGIILSQAKRTLAGLHDGFFSRSGLTRLLRRNVDYQKIIESNTKFYVSAFNVEKNKVEYFDVHTAKDGSEVESMILASSALPVVFGLENLRGYNYYDGGLGDNCPVRPLYELGYRKFIVIWLSNNVTEDVRKHTEQFPDAFMLNIVPSVDQGNFITGTLDFSSEGIHRRIEQGYSDAINILCNAFSSTGIEKYTGSVSPKTTPVMPSKEVIMNTVKIIKKLDRRSRSLFAPFFGK